MGAAAGSGSADCPHIRCLNRRQLFGLVLLSLAWGIGGCASIFDPPASYSAKGFSLISPDLAARLGHAPPSSERSAALRFAERVRTRTPRAMKRIHTEGTLPGQGIRDLSQEAKKDFPASLELALAARLTGDAGYAEAAAKLIEAWAKIYVPSFNPIDETPFDELFVAWDLLPEPQRRPLVPAMTKLLYRFCTGYLANPLKGTNAKNNWNSHRVKLIVLSAFALGDPDLVMRARAAYDEQLRLNIRDDGSTFDFYQRDAIHYVTYSLEPLAVAAFAAWQHGQDWTGDENRALLRGFAWLEPYASRAKTHEEFLNTTVAFDRIRRDAGVPGFEGQFDPKHARKVMGLAARLDPRFIATARALRTGASQEHWEELIAPMPAAEAAPVLKIR